VVKEQIFGLNAARVFGVDVNATRHELPNDYLSRIYDALMAMPALAPPHWVEPCIPQACSLHHLSPWYRVVRPDMRGFGASTPMPRDFPWTLDLLIDDFAQFIAVCSA
jgi:pimeloyl-ACP methyl ester carboxylesterase